MTMNSYNPGTDMGMKFIWALIGVNTAVYVAVDYSSPSGSGIPGFHLTSNPSLYYKLRRNLPLSLDNIREGKYWTIITSGFTHFGLYHLIGNMFALHAFGSYLARGTTFSRPLPVPNLAILAFGSLVSGSCFFLINQKKRERFHHTVEGIGASGMAMGLGAAAALLAPKSRLLIWGIIPVPLWLLIGGYFVIDYGLLGSNTGVAHEGHLGGLAFGVLYYVLTLRRFGGILAKRAIKPASNQVWRGRR